MKGKSSSEPDKVYLNGESENTGLTVRIIARTAAEADPLVILSLIGNYRRAGGTFRLSQLKEALVNLEKMSAEAKIREHK